MAGINYKPSKIGNSLLLYPHYYQIFVMYKAQGQVSVARLGEPILLTKSSYNSGKNLSKAVRLEAWDL